MTEKTPADIFIDNVVAALHKEKAPYIVRELADKVLRPYLNTLDAHHESAASPLEFADAVETICAMMISNLVDRVAKPDDFSHNADVTQELVDGIAGRLSASLAQRFEDKPKKPKLIGLDGGKK